MTKDTVDGMNIFNCGLEFKNTTHLDMCQTIQDMVGWSSSILWMGWFGYRVIGRQKQRVKC